MRSPEKKYPQTVVFVDKENGGHGSTINVGIEKAQVTYFNLLDSDVWVIIGDFIEFVKKANVLFLDYSDRKLTHCINKYAIAMLRGEKS